MPFDWSEYLSLAQWLQTNTPPGMSDECARRTAVSRAYYAAFGFALDYAVNYLDFQPRNAAEDHGRLQNHLKEKKRFRVGQELERLRKWRNDCDYQVMFPGDLAAILANALNAAQYVFGALQPPQS